MLLFSRSVVSDSLQPHGLWPARLLCPSNSPARALEWAAIPCSGGSSRPRAGTCASYVSGIGRWVLYCWCHLGSPSLMAQNVKCLCNNFRYIGSRCITNLNSLQGEVTSGRHSAVPGTAEREAAERGPHGEQRSCQPESGSDSYL